MSSGSIYPVILSGGSGTRLWPLSRLAYPKQLLALTGDDSLVQQTAKRLGPAYNFAPPTIICNEAHRFIIAEQLRAVDIPSRGIILEPIGRNTAPAAAVAALDLVATDPDAVMLLAPSDHVIQDEAAFRTALETATQLVASGHLVTFGVTPTAPATGYGYIEADKDSLPAIREGFAIKAFVEKPDIATAETFVRSGRYYWNSGMFLLKAGQYLEELCRLQPDIMAAARAAWSEAEKDLTFRRLPEPQFAKSPSLSIDYAVMEHTENGAVVPAAMGWSDVGSWTALWELASKDDDNNATFGQVQVFDSRNCYLRGDKKRLLVGIGLDDLIVIDTADALLVAHRDKAEQVKSAVERLSAEDRVEVTQHRRVYRPWGYYETIDEGERFQVKQLGVHPGASLSLQMHHHRAEHWIVVRGTAKVTRGDDELLLQENESIYIPLGTRHRLHNPGKIELQLIEVQSGSYLGEDDIVRFDDQYGRNEKIA